MRGTILHLGGFHTEMNFLGSIGHLLGCKECSSLSMLPMHAEWQSYITSCACTLIVDAALNALMLHSGFNTPLPCQWTDENCAEVGDLDEAHTLYEKLVIGEIRAEVCSSNVLERIKDNFKSHSESVKKSSRTSALLGSVHEHDQHLAQIHQSRARWKLVVTYAGYSALHGSFWPQLLHQVWHVILAADVEPQD